MKIINIIGPLLQRLGLMLGLLAVVLLPVAPSAWAEGAATTSAWPGGAVSIVGDPTAVGTPVGNRGPKLVKFHLEAQEVLGILDPATKSTFMYWTFNGKVPGPLLRARVGDTVEITLSNKSDSQMIHNIDLHAVWGQGGGAAYTSVGPGESKTFTFVPQNPGLFVYHCATPIIPQHMSSGMYGMILIEPAGGLPKVDREFYFMQGELYTDDIRSSLDVTKGSQPDEANNIFNLDKMMNESPSYVTFNGSAGGLAANPMKAKVGETVRIFFGVGGPNLTSSFHAIGTIFDKVWNPSLTSPPLTDVQTTVVAVAGSAMVEMKLRVPAKFIFVDHSLTRLQKGCVAILQAEGPEQPSIVHNGPAE